MSARADLGLVGLGTMGGNLALNFDDHGVTVAAWNLEPERTEAFLAEHPGRALVGARTFEELVAALERPRRVLLMIPAGDPVDETLGRLAPLLDEGDIVVDGGNSHFEDTARRIAELAGGGVRLVGMGVSGGSEGARRGPSLMPGGPRAAYDALAPILESIAATTDAGPCVGYLGAGGSGHLVKMVHNGIEYADMQSIAEAYDLLHRGLGLDADELAATFAGWNDGPLGSYLVEITAGIFTVADSDGGAPLVDQILDEAAQKGTGRWTAIAALEAGVPAPSISAAVDARALSSRRDERLAAAERVAGPGPRIDAGRDERSALVDAVGAALLGTRITAFAQGFDLLRDVATGRGWEIPRAEVARVWRGGCIIRCRLLDPIRAALQRRPDLAVLLEDPDLARSIEGVQAGWRRALAAAVAHGIPTPCWSASLAWLDGYRTGRLPHNLTQAQRDWFGAHGYRRLDDPDARARHTDWAGLASGVA